MLVMSSIGGISKLVENLNGSVPLYLVGEVFFRFASDNKTGIFSKKRKRLSVKNWVQKWAKNGNGKSKPFKLKYFFGR